MVDEYTKSQKTKIYDQVIMYLIGQIDGIAQTHKAEYKGLPTKQVNIELGRLADQFDSGSRIRILFAGEPNILSAYETAARINLLAGTKLNPRITLLRVNSGLEVLINPLYGRAYVLSPDHSDYSDWDFARGNPGVLEEVDF